jgi:hypothetical protein
MTQKRLRPTPLVLIQGGRAGNYGDPGRTSNSHLTRNAPSMREATSFPVLTTASWQVEWARLALPYKAGVGWGEQGALSFCHFRASDDCPGTRARAARTLAP